jgi:hypothetical protein
LKLSLRTARSPNWLTAHAYRRQVKNRTIANISEYPAQYAAYSREVRGIAEFVRQHVPVVKTAMVCSVGGSFEEIDLIADNFPTVSHLHLVDWHRPNIDSLIHYLTQHPVKGREIEIILHHADLRRPESVPKGRIDLAFAHKVFDLYQRSPIEMQALLDGIRTRLAKNGILFSFDYPLDPVEDINNFYGLASAVGFDKIRERVLKRI